jgi:hypothetical protein
MSFVMRMIALSGSAKKMGVGVQISPLCNILRVQWYELVDRLNHVVLSGGWGQDMAIWKWPPWNKMLY